MPDKVYYWIHRDQQAQAGDLRRVQILTTNELSLITDLRGPYDKLEDALKIAENLIWSIMAKVMYRLRSEAPKKHATFPPSQNRSGRVAQRPDFPSEKPKERQSFFSQFFTATAYCCTYFF